jgi:hypothetical protein
MFKIYIKQRLSLLKKYLLLLGIVFLSCTNHNNSKTQVIQSDYINITENNDVQPLIIGGKQYYGPVVGYSEENLRYNAIILHESKLLDETEAQRSTKWLIFNVSILRDG